MTSLGMKIFVRLSLYQKSYNSEAKPPNHPTRTSEVNWLAPKFEFVGGSSKLEISPSSNYRDSTEF